MRAPGEAIGTFALESAVDETGHTAWLDPIELRMRNEPAAARWTDKKFSHQAAARGYAPARSAFGWARRSAATGIDAGRPVAGRHGLCHASTRPAAQPADVTVRLSR